MNIHKTAIISKKAKIAEDVRIGPNVVIEDGVEIGPGCEIWANAYICRGTTLGKDNRVHMGAILGHEPQDLAYSGTPSFVRIGDNNTFREYFTVHRGTKEDTITAIGDNNYFMALSHIAHNCTIGDNIVMCNNTLVAGHVEIENNAFISGNCAIHQFVRIGAYTMVGGGARVAQDLPPYMLAKGDSVVWSYNKVGLSRAGFSKEATSEIKRAYRFLYLSGLNTTQALEEIEKALKTDEVRRLVGFIRSSKRGICSGKHSL